MRHFKPLLYHLTRDPKLLQSVPDDPTYELFEKGVAKLVVDGVTAGIAGVGSGVTRYVKKKYQQFKHRKLPKERLLVEPVMRMRRRNVRRRRPRVRRSKRTRPNRSRRRTVSQYHENATDYVRGRRGRKSSGFAKRVLRAIIGESPTYQITRQAVGVVNWAAGAQSIFGTMMYQVSTGAGGALGPTMTGGDDSDILRMFDFLNSTMASAAAASVFQSRKLFLRMAYLEVYITNTTATSSIEVDAYEIVCRKQYQAISDIGTAFTTLFAETPAATGAVKSATNPSVTVFQNNAFCKHFAVIRRTTHFIEPNKTIRMELSSNKSFMVEGELLLDTGLCLTRARGYLFIAKTLPASGSAFPAGTIAWGYTKRYRFQQPPSYGVTDLTAQT